AITGAARFGAPPLCAGPRLHAPLLPSFASSRDLPVGAAARAGAHAPCSKARGRHRAMAIGRTAMMHALGWAGAMAAILVICLWLGTRKARLRRTEQAWLPVELQHARIEFAERYFYAKRPVRLIAKVDRVYKDERGT